jgi:hypothetical protein
MQCLWKKDCISSENWLPFMHLPNVKYYVTFLPDDSTMQATKLSVPGRFVCEHCVSLLSVSLIAENIGCCWQKVMWTRFVHYVFVSLEIFNRLDHLSYFLHNYKIFQSLTNYKIVNDWNIYTWHFLMRSHII